MRLVDPGCQAMVRAFARRNLRSRAPRSSAPKHPMYRRSGSSYDLKSIREYQPFDDPRSIDWKLYARSGRAYVKEFYDEADDEIAMLVDSSASMGCAAGDEVRRCAGSLAFMFLSLGLGVRLWTFASNLSPTPVAARAGSGYGGVEAALLALEFAGPGDSRRSYAQWRAKGRQRRVFVLSDFHEPGPGPAAPPSGQAFLLRFRTPFGELADYGAEAEALDPESGKTIVVPWTRGYEARLDAEDRDRDERLRSAPRTFYRRLDAGSGRDAAYWDILERLYA